MADKIVPVVNCRCVIDSDPNRPAKINRDACRFDPAAAAQAARLDTGVREILAKLEKVPTYTAATQYRSGLRAGLEFALLALRVEP